MENNNFNLIDSEEKSLVGLLYNHISFGTTMEMFNELGEGGLARLNNLRNVFRKLVSKYNLTSQFSSQDFLLLGLIDFVSDEDLKYFKESGNNHLKNRVLYFSKSK
jgi:hypothetical protein